MKQKVEKLELLFVGTKENPVQKDIDLLHQKSKEVDSEIITGERIQSIINAMFDIMYEKQGIGLAAPMCRIPGKKENLQLRILVIDLDVEYSPKFKKGKNPLVFINPKISNVSEEKIFYEKGEGNLCIPSRRYKVPRHKNFTIEYFDRHAEKKILKVDGGKYSLLSICIQHEFDHLNGITIMDAGELINS